MPRIPFAGCAGRVLFRREWPSAALMSWLFRPPLVKHLRRVRIHPPELGSFPSFGRVFDSITIRSINRDDSLTSYTANLLKKAIKPRVLVPRWSHRNGWSQHYQPEVRRRWTPVQQLDARNYRRFHMDDYGCRAYGAGELVSDERRTSDTEAQIHHL